MSYTDLIGILKRSRSSFHPVVSFDHTKEKLLLLDLTERNEQLSNDILNDTAVFTTYIDQQLKNAGAKFGTGGYAEHRTIYSSSKVFDGHDANEEPRRLHLGNDIWGKPHTAVMAPIDGIVHSFAFNGRFRDYGATIILTHQLEGVGFYTLYGHLSLNSIKNIQEGDRINRGDMFAEFGIPAENGQWPPHLHFQIIADIGEHKGDHPGVCKFSEREKWLANSPDPDIILKLHQFLPKQAI